MCPYPSYFRRCRKSVFTQTCRYKKIHARRVRATRRACGFWRRHRDGLKREVMEEFGKEITVGDPFAAFTYTNTIKGSHSIEVAYFAQFQSDTESITVHTEDHSGYAWFSETEIDTMLTGGKTSDDEEYQLIRKAFKVLRGEPLNLGA